MFYTMLTIAQASLVVNQQWFFGRQLRKIASDGRGGGGIGRRASLRS